MSSGHHTSKYQERKEMKWYKLNALAIHVMIAGIALEIILKAHWAWVLFSVGCTIQVMAEKSRLKQLRKRRPKK